MFCGYYLVIRLAGKAFSYGCCSMIHIVITARHLNGISLEIVPIRLKFLMVLELETQQFMIAFDQIPDVLNKNE